MKKSRLWIAGLLALLALASCYWRPDFNAGGLSLDVSGIKPRAVGDVVRVYLIADGLLFSTGGGVPFSAEVPLTAGYLEGQQIAINGLPVGPKYQVMVGIGQLANGVFNPSWYGESGQFVLTPNADTVVTIPSMSSIPFTAYYYSPSPNPMDKTLKAVVESGYSVYTAGDRNIYLTSFDTGYYTWTLDDSFDLSTDLDVSGESLSSYQVNGLSNGVLYNSTSLDTDDGMLPFYGGDGWSFSKAFAGTLSGNRDIKASGSFVVAPAYTDYAVFFRRENGLGGAYVASSAWSYPDTWSWINLDVPGVTDMIVSNYNAYFVANEAAFALPGAQTLFLEDGDLAAHRADLTAPAPVLSLGYRPAASLPATLSLGTTDGVYQGTVSESSTDPCASLPTTTLVAVTAGDAIERIAISSTTITMRRTFPDTTCTSAAIIMGCRKSRSSPCCRAVPRTWSGTPTAPCTFPGQKAWRLSM